MAHQLLVGLLLAASAPEGAAAKPVWHWESEFGACALRQDFDGGGSLLISRTPTGDTTSLSIADNRAQVRTWSEVPQTRVTLEPGGSIDADGFVQPGKSNKGRTIGVAVTDPGFLDHLSKASAVELSHSKFGSVRTAIRSPSAAVEALIKCEDRKMREWGIDPASLQVLQSRPRPTMPLYKWFSTDDYPRLAIAYRVKSDVVALVDVGPDGTVRKCTVINRQLVTLFKDATCRVLKDRARFHPAIGADGTPVSAPFVVRVRFTLG
jgi:hypothetical protein